MGVRTGASDRGLALNRFWLYVLACMVAVALLVWFVPGAAGAVENLILGLLVAVEY